MEAADKNPFSEDVDVFPIVEEIERNGFAVFENCVSPQEIIKARSLIENLISENDNETIATFGFDIISGAFPKDLESSLAFKAMCRRICEAAGGAVRSDARLVPSLRCLSGQSAATHSMVFHYDSFLLTVIFPIIIPHGEQSGRLVLVPNTRRIRTTYLRNLLDKILVDNKHAQKRLAKLHAANSDRLRYIDMQPGNAYIFWGYRSIHTNEACDSSQIRSTAIFHCVDPHEKSGMKRLLGR